jgi:hypothetical protein
MSRRTGTPLPRRTTDRVEDAAAWVLSAAMLLVAVVAVVVGLSVHDSEAARARAESAGRVPATAVLTTDAPISTGDSAGTVRVPVTAVWTDQAGRRHTGWVAVPAGLPAGTARPVWLDRSGDVVPAPRTDVQVVFAAVATAVLILAGGVLLLGSIWSAVRRLTAARNAAAWAREWERVEPQWRRGDTHPGSGSAPGEGSR